jgi:hypothetical protein
MLVYRTGDGKGLAKRNFGMADNNAYSSADEALSPPIPL